jgi:C-terminal peptidase prc
MNVSLTPELEQYVNKRVQRHQAGNGEEGSSVKQTMQKPLTWFIILSVATIVRMPGMASADDASPTPAFTAPQPPANLAKRVGEITDAVLTHHIDPPARQQMILGGVKALYSASGVQVPAGLSRRVSALATPEQLAELLVEVWPKSLAKPVAPRALEEALLEGFFNSIPGGGYLVSAKERKVAEQVAGNRYVGIQIALAMDDGEKLARIAQIYEGGPADRAGAKTNDLIEKIGGTDTKGLTLSEVVDRLRGDEGTDVTITVRQPKTKESRTLTMTRASMPRTTVQGFRKRQSGGWDVRADGFDAVGYLRITDITASTPHEFRNLARRLENEGARAVILDLRGLRSSGSFYHSTVLLADSLLDHGPIGRVRTVEREMSFEADSDALLQGWPVAVLIDGTTSGTAEWLAAALQDNHRAVLVGSPAAGALGRPDADVRSTVAVGAGLYFINVVTGYLERGDGRLLGRAPSSAISFDPSEARLLRGGAAKTNGGVKPDHTVGMKGITPDVLNDATVRKAVELLRISPKKA